MAKTRLSPAATYVERGFGQVEPNHLSAQRTAQIYAQLPAAANINVLENGQFVKYNYKDGVVDFAGLGEWMLVFNEVKVYRDHEADNDFAMKKEDYVARVYTPGADVKGYANARNYEGVVNAYEHDITSTTNPFVIEQRGTDVEVKIDDVDYTLTVPYTPMAKDTNMVPRVFKTNVGDIFTTNTIALEVDDQGKVLESELKKIEAGAFLAPNAEGYLAPIEDINEKMTWQIVKVYTLADRQRAVKIMRIA